MSDADYDSPSDCSMSPQSNYTHSSNAAGSSASAMNPTASSFSPCLGPRRAPSWATPPKASFNEDKDQYSPNNPYRHAASSMSQSPGTPIVILPKVFSPQDIYEFSRAPSGNVITTAGGQQVEFWERVQNMGTSSAPATTTHNRSHNRTKRHNRRNHRRHR